MMLFDPQIMTGLESYLDVAARRQTLIASNMANIDTPGYQTQDLDFSQALNDAESGLDPAAAQHAVGGLLARPDGNNVNLDRESLLMAQTQLQYSTGISLLREEFHRLNMAINGGSGGSTS
ncbi:MAG TPA: flagellar basal body protein [Terriglobales bacterium]|nr:flagellar basal body protein [Terriglobales bacterium]